MHLSGKQGIQLNAEGNAEETADHSRTEIATNTYQTKTQSGDIHHHANQDYQLKAEKEIILQSEKSMHINSQQDIFLQAMQGVNIQADEIALKASQNDLNISSHSDIHIEAKETAHFSVGGDAASVDIKNGTLTISGKQIQLHADSKLILSGEINYGE